MPRDLCGAVTSPPVAVGNRTWYTVPISLAAHVAVMVPIILVPLLATDILPMPNEYDVFVSAPPPPPEPPPPVAPAAPKPVTIGGNIRPPQKIRDALPGVSRDCASRTCAGSGHSSGNDRCRGTCRPSASPAFQRATRSIGNRRGAAVEIRRHASQRRAGSRDHDGDGHLQPGGEVMH
jgi:hypothetical protein